MYGNMKILYLGCCRYNILYVKHGQLCPYIWKLVFLYQKRVQVAIIDTSLVILEKQFIYNKTNIILHLRPFIQIKHIKQNVRQQMF